MFSPSGFIRVHESKDIDRRLFAVTEISSKRGTRRFSKFPGLNGIHFLESAWINARMGPASRLTKFLRHPCRRVSMTLQFIARVVELVDTQVSEACA